MSIITAISEGHTNLAIFPANGNGEVVNVIKELTRDNHLVEEIWAYSYEPSELTDYLGNTFPNTPHPGFTDGDTVVVSIDRDAAEDTFELITEVLTSRTLRGTKLDNLKNVIIATYGEDERVTKLIESGVLTHVAQPLAKTSNA